MHTVALYLSLFHLLLYFAAATTATEIRQPYTPTDYYLLNCGSSSNSTTSLDGRIWDGDSHSKVSPSNIQSKSSASTASEQDPSVAEVPYKTARIFHSKFTYSFPVSEGQKFLRLYFYPGTYSRLDKSKSYFSVTANSFTLLSNFSAFLTVSDIKPLVATIIKEFVINVHTNEMQLNLTFVPSPSSYAFLNGIEVVSMPNNFYTENIDSTHIPIFLSKHKTFFYFDDTTALETVYRVNVGGGLISSVDDTGMYRIWRQDDYYIFGSAFGLADSDLNVTIQYTEKTPAYTAPEIVYTTYRTMGLDFRVNLNYNLSWYFPVDVGFLYLVRLHFCEPSQKVTLVNQRVFRIFINNQTAMDHMDVIGLSGGSKIPVYNDYVVLVPNEGHGKQDLWLELHPLMESKPQFGDAILNGVEIFKLNKSDGSLAGPNPDPPLVATLGPQFTKSKNNRRTKKIIIVCAISVVALLISILSFFIYRRGMGLKARGSSLPSHLCRYFSLAELKVATNDFDNVLLIGVGGFGNVYKGYIDDGATPVAIKRLKSGSKQGAREFITEIKMLSQLRHLNLVSLIGYCNDDHEMILVYDYMARGTLRDHLYDTDNRPLTWKQRLEICINTARGLHYLHMGATHMIIHRDVKTTNILLDEKWVAKLSDFGLSKEGPTSVSKTHVSTAVKGSFGYMDPEYYLRQRLTEKSDVYSFGVVLFEVLCGRPPLLGTVQKRQVNLAEWARRCYHDGTLDQIVDPFLKGKIAPECLNKFGEIAVNCLLHEGIERPSMNDVVQDLEFTLQLQESTNDNNLVDDQENIFQKSEIDVRCELQLQESANDNSLGDDQENIFQKSEIDARCEFSGLNDTKGQ